jgi:hypothetical protein
MLESLLDLSPDATRRLVRAVQKRKALEVAQEIAEPEMLEDQKRMALLVRHLLSLRDPDEVCRSYDEAVAAGHAKPHCAALEALGITGNSIKALPLGALLRHEPFLRRLDEARSSYALRRELGISQRLRGRIEEAVRNWKGEPPPEKPSEGCLLVAETWHPSSFVSLLCAHLSAAGLGCLFVPLEETAARRKRCKLTASTEESLSGSKRVLVEDGVFQALLGHTCFNNDMAVTPVPPLERWQDSRGAEALRRIDDAELRKVLGSAVDAAVQGMWGGTVVLVPLRSSTLEEAGVQQIAVATPEQARSRLRAPPGARQSRQLRVWGFCRNQGWELWQLVQRFDRLGDTPELPEEVRFLGKAPEEGPPDEETNVPPLGVVFLHDKGAEKTAAAAAARSGAHAVKAEPFTTLEELRSAAEKGLWATSMATAVVLCGDAVERYGELLVAPRVPTVRWSEGIDMRSAFVRRHAPDEGVEAPVEAPDGPLELEDKLEDIPEDVRHHFGPSELVAGRLQDADTSAVRRALASARDECAALELGEGALDVLVSGAHHKTVVGRAQCTYVEAFVEHLSESTGFCARWELRKLAHEADSAFAQQVLCVRVRRSRAGIAAFLAQLAEATGDVPGPEASKSNKRQALEFYGAWTWEPKQFTGTLTQPATMEAEEFLEQATRRAVDAKTLADCLEGRLRWSKEVPLVVSELLRRGYTRRAGANLAWIGDLRSRLTEEKTDVLVSWARSTGSKSVREHLLRRL